MNRSTLFVAGACALAFATAAHATGFGPSAPRRCGAPAAFPSARAFSGLRAVGLTADQRLICFDEDVPALATAIGAISGLDGDTRLVGIDVRPATGALWGLGDGGGLYEISLDDATATRRAQLSVALDGAAFDVDFNPTVDRLRVISDAGQNLRVNVDTGAATEDSDLNYPPPANVNPATGVTGAAYTNNDGHAETATTLYDLDTALDQIVVQSPPNAGPLAATGKLVLDATADAGFDIYTVVRGGRATDNRALAVLTVGGRPRLYQINLLTGRASLRGTFGARHPVVDLAIPLNQF